MVHLLGLSPQVMQRHSCHSHRLTQMDREGAEVPCVHEKGVKVILKEEQGTGDLSAVILRKSNLLLCETLFSWAPKSLQMVTTAMKLKDVCSLKEKL